MSDQPVHIPLTVQKAPSKNQQRRQLDRYLMIAAVAAVVVAWLYGYLTTGTDVLPLVGDVVPDAVRVERQGDLYVAWGEDDRVPLGYAAVGEAPGYGGPITMLVGVNPAGEITGVTIVSQVESPGFFRLVESSDLLASYLGQPIDAPLRLGEDLDAVSGATRSAEGIAAGIRAAVRDAARDGLNSPLPPEQRPIQFGWPEVVLIALYVGGYVGHKLRNKTWQHRIRWGTLLTGMVVLGFVYTAPFTITMVTSLVSGYWPDWHNNLYWYLLFGGILFVTTVDAKNPYCSWFCPFGAYQEVLGTLTKAKLYKPRDLAHIFTWVQRSLALIAIVLGLALRRPGVASYEPFATLFDLRGTGLEWAFLAIVTLASLVMYRPFCNYLCPLDPVVDFIAAGRKWLLEGWRRWRKPTAKTP